MRMLAATQRGFMSLGIGMVGLVMCGVVAAPVMVRAATALRAQETTSPTGDDRAAISAAEHGLWRVENDAAFLDGLTGDPPSDSYTLDLPTGQAEVTVTQSSAAPAGSGIDVFLSFSPNLIPPSTPTQVTFTLRVINNSNSAASIDRVEATALLFAPTYVNGSTTGFTTADPTYVGFGKWRWTVAPAASVPPFGGETSMSWRMTLNVPEGMYWTLASARLVGIGTEYAPLSSYIRAASMQTVAIDTEVTPSVVTAGSMRTYTYTIEVINNGSTTSTIDWLRHYTKDDFDYQISSTTGFTTADPTVSWDWINGRNEHYWNVSVPIPAGQSAILTMSVEADVPPGTYYAQTAVRVEEDSQSSGWESTAETGDAAPIEVIRAYEVVATIGNGSVSATITLDSSGVRVASWEED
jgi:hypothetical protein